MVVWLVVLRSDAGRERCEGRGGTNYHVKDIRHVLLDTYMFHVSRAASSRRSLRGTLPRYFVPFFVLFRNPLRGNVGCFEQKHGRADGLGRALPRAVAFARQLIDFVAVNVSLPKTDTPTIVVSRCCCPPGQPSGQRFAPNDATHVTSTRVLVNTNFVSRCSTHALNDRWRRIKKS